MGIDGVFATIDNLSNHRRTGQHPFGGGGQTEFCPNGFGGGEVVTDIFRDPYYVGGGGVVAEIFRDPYSAGCQNFFSFSVNSSSNRP